MTFAMSQTTVGSVSDGIEKMGASGEYEVQHKREENENSPPNKRQLLKEFAGDTSCHGARNVADSKYKLGSLFWALCMLAMFIWCLVHITQQFQAYQSATTVQDLSYSYERPMPFPSVTFCNFNRFKHSVLEEMSQRYSVDFKMLWEYMVLLLHTSYDLSLDDSDLNKTLVYLQKVHDAIEAVDGEFHALRFLQNATFSYTDYLMQGLLDNWFQCSWNGKNYRACDPSMFRRLFTLFGSCLVFNPHSPTNEFVQTLEGGLSGFFATFDAKLNESSERVTLSIRGYLSTGVLVIVHPHGTFPDLSTESIIAEAGRHAQLGLKAVKQILKDTWNNPCYHGEDESRWKYSQAFCKLRCIANTTRNMCNCIPSAYYLNSDIKNDTPVCHTPAHFGCQWYYQTWRPLYQNIETCVKLCLVPCEEMQYPPGIATVTAQNPEIIDSVSPNNSTKHDYIKRNAASIEIHVDSFVQKTIQHKLKTTIPDVFASLGGQMGLALGASLLTVIEFLEFLCFLILRPVIFKERKK